jgi:hypothetical protein
MGLTIGQAGLDAAMRRLDAAAWGIARASNAQAAAGPPAGPEAAAPAQPQAPQMPGFAAPAQGAPAPGDLPAQMIGLMTASHAVTANLQVIRRADEALRGLLEGR